MANRRDNRIELDFPATPAEKVEPPDGLLDALGATAVYVGRTRFDYLVELATEDDVRTLEPSFSRLEKLGTRGIMVTAATERSEFDFVSRFFAPSAGVPEDPVTGSAHCALAPYWNEKLGRTELVGYQASKRGGIVRCRMANRRVFLSGHAVTILRGEILA